MALLLFPFLCILYLEKFYTFACYKLQKRFLFIMGIRKKILLGFLVIGIVLLLSGVIAIYEFVKMRNTVHTLVIDNINSINASNLLLEVTDEYNFSLLESMGAEGTADIPDIKQDTRFTDHLSNATNTYMDLREQNMADSVIYAYTAYIHVMKEAPLVWQRGYQERRSWYFDRMYAVERIYSGIDSYLSRDTCSQFL